MLLNKHSGRGVFADSMPGTDTSLHHAISDRFISLALVRRFAFISMPLGACLVIERMQRLALRAHAVNRVFSHAVAYTPTGKNLPQKK
jgi:hypothetical protein